MFKKGIILFCAIFISTVMQGQEKEIKIEEERRGNRLMLYALNENFEDVEATIVVEGTGFRQSARAPRAMKIPKLSKVHVVNLMVNKGETPKYTTDITVSDSISRRALRKEATAIRIDPMNPIDMYIAENCVGCDSIVAKLERSPYKYRSTVLNENEEIKRQIAMANARLDTVVTPLFNVKGGIVSDIETFEELMEKLNDGEKGIVEN
ncbi:MAG: hypothetical protein ACSHW7_06755 [Patiriisocius sp.]|uniref:hypothetical protein n=1 Tax=Patiriisocius sp. TaxID=2822396 RepID=UPI003EF575A3